MGQLTRWPAREEVVAQAWQRAHVRSHEIVSAGERGQAGNYRARTVGKSSARG